MSYDRHKDWLDEAEDDLSSAEILLRGNKYSKACFLSQQAAEKDIIEIGEILDRYYIPTRYPNVWLYGAPCKHYKKRDVEEVLENARRIIEYIRSQIKRDY